MRTAREFAHAVRPAMLEPETVPPLTTAYRHLASRRTLDRIRVLQREHGTTVLTTTHDMGVVAKMATIWS